MTVYLNQGMAFEPKRKRIIAQKKKSRKTWPRLIAIRMVMPEVFRAFFISSLVFINLGLIAIAGLWFLLVFSVVTPVELIEMYYVQPPQALITEDSEYTLATLNVPPPPALSLDAYGGLASNGK